MAKDYLSPVWSHLTQLLPVRGEGIYLYDSDGTQYTDCGRYENVIRWIAPLIVSAAQNDDALSVFADVLREIVGEPAAQYA